MDAIKKMNRYVAYMFIRVSSNEKCQINLRNITAINPAAGCELHVQANLAVSACLHPMYMYDGGK